MQKQPDGVQPLNFPENLFEEKSWVQNTELPKKKCWVLKMKSLKVNAKLEVLHSS